MLLLLVCARCATRSHLHHDHPNMVGYNKNDTMTANQKLIAGCISGAMTRFITQPLDVIKLRTQLHKKGTPKPQGRFFKFTRQIFTQEGLAAFWLGHNSGQLHSILAVSSQFYIYEQATRFVATSKLDHIYNKPLLTFLCGVLAGCCSAALVIPLDVIRVRQMLGKNQYSGLWKGAREVYDRGGIFAFYEGLNATLLQVGPAVGLSFEVFSLVQPMILNMLSECGEECRHAPGNEHDPAHLLVATTGAGLCAGFVSKTLTYPFDLAKRRMQIRTHKHDEKLGGPTQKLAACHGLISCIRRTYKEEGIIGLYRGWKVTIYKAQLTSMVAFTTYELVCYAIREVESH